MKKIALVVCSLVLLSACSSSDDSTADATTSAPAAATAEAVSKDPVAVCGALFDGADEGTVARIVALAGVPVDETVAAEVGDLRQDLVAAIAKSPTDLASSIEDLRTPLGEVVSKVGSGEADVTLDAEAVTAAVATLTTTCEDAGYTVEAS